MKRCWHGAETEEKRKEVPTKVDIVALIVAIAALVVSIYVAYSSQYRERDHDELGETREELSEQMSEVEKNICDKLDAMNKQYSCDLIEIKTSTSAVQRQVEIINLRCADLKERLQDAKQNT